MTVGFVAVFALTGLLFRFVSTRVVTAIPWFAVAVGVVLLVYGVLVVFGRGQLTIRLPNPAERRGSHRSGLLFGLGYAIASLSCTLPVFLTVVAGTLARGAAAGVGGFVAYGLGMGTIVFAVAISMALARDGLVRALRRSGRYLERVSGAVLALAGAYLLLYWGYALGPGSNPTASSSAPGPVRFLTGLSSSASRFLDSSLGRFAVVALAIGVLVTVVVAAVARVRYRSTSSTALDQECPTCPPNPSTTSATTAPRADGR